MSSGGGKGGESKNELDPEMKAMARKVFQRGEALSKTAPVPYTGITMAAPSAATKSSWSHQNNAANSLGLGIEGDPSDGIMMTERKQGPMKGYGAHEEYTRELQRAWREYPERMQALNQLIPGLMNPGKTHSQNAAMFPHMQRPQGPRAPGYDFSQIASMYNQGRKR